MKKFLFKPFLILILCSISNPSFAQNDAHIKFRSVFAEVGMFTSLDNSWDSGDFNGVSFSGGLDFLWDDVIFGARISAGTNPDLVDYFEKGDENYFEWDFIVGREWKISPSFSFEANVGVGLFYHKIETASYSFEDKFFALSLKPHLRYYLSDHFSLALGSQFNILPLFLTGGISIQYHFN